MQINNTTHIETLAAALKKVSPHNPLLKTMRSRYERIKSGEPPGPGKPLTHAWQRPHAKYVFDPDKETWAEFKKRAQL